MGRYISWSELLFMFPSFFVSLFPFHFSINVSFTLIASCPVHIMVFRFPSAFLYIALHGAMMLILALGKSIG